MSGQAWLFFYTVLFGVGVGIFYDLFRVLRKTMPHASFAVQLEDVFFWVAVTGCMFYFMLSQNYGEIRPFTLIGAACGLAIYFATVSQYVVKTLAAVVAFICKVVAGAVRIILLPIRFILGFITPPIKKFAANRRRNLRTGAKYGRIHMKKLSRSWFILRKKV